MAGATRVSLPAGPEPSLSDLSPQALHRAWQTTGTPQKELGQWMPGNLLCASDSPALTPTHYGAPTACRGQGHLYPGWKARLSGDHLLSPGIKQVLFL